MIVEPWKRNFYVMFATELIVLMGLSLVIPFLPLYLQQANNLTTEDAAFWAGIAGSAAGIAMFFAAPIWGILADRWGRKSMVLRAMFSGGIILALMGVFHNIFAIVLLRTLQGLFSGTIAAASALVASGTPREKMPATMGLLMVAFYGGGALGPLLGGFLAETFALQGSPGKK